MTRINISTQRRTPIMPQITESLSFAGYLDTQRETIRQSLDAISKDIVMQMRDAGLGSIPVYLVVPNSGDAWATAATPLDPPDHDWSRVLEIVCRVIQQKIGSGKLRSRKLVCTAINTSLTSADLTSE